MQSREKIRTLQAHSSEQSGRAHLSLGPHQESLVARELINSRPTACFRFKKSISGDKLERGSGAFGSWLGPIHLLFLGNEWWTGGKMSYSKSRIKNQQEVAERDTMDGVWLVFWVWTVVGSQFSM